MCLHELFLMIVLVGGHIGTALWVRPYENICMFIHANVTGLIELSVIINMQYLPRVHIS